MDRTQSPSMASPHEYYSSSSEFPQYYEPQIVHPDQYTNSEGPRSNLSLGIPYPPTPHSGASPTNAFEYHRSSSLQHHAPSLHHQQQQHQPHHLYNGAGEPPSPGAVQNVSPPLTHMSASDLGTDATGGGAPPPYSHSNDGTSSPASSHESARYHSHHHHHHPHPHHQPQHHQHQQHPHQQQQHRGEPMIAAYGHPAAAAPAQAPSSLVHRRSHRGSNASTGGRTSTAAAREMRRKPRRSNSTVEDEFGSDDEDLGPPYANEGGGGVTKRREEVRRQRIESEQRRRDELRDGYRKLKDVLPVSNQKSSKVSLLDRATTHIKQLEVTQAHMLNKIAELEAETARLRHVNETLMLSAAEVRRNSAGSY